MSFLEKNLSYIRKYNNDLAQKIALHSDLTQEFQLEEAQSGAVNLLKDNIPIHSKIDPEQEAIDILNSTLNQKLSIAVLYGLGLGYLLDRFNKSFKGKIIVYEPDLDVLRIAFEMVDFSEYFAKETVILVNNINELEKAYETLFYIGYDCKLCLLDYYKKYDSENVNEFVNKLFDIHSIYQSNYKNMHTKSSIWTKAGLESAYYSSRGRDINCLKDKFAGKTAVIISAGPSLSKNIEHVRSYRDKVVVFCVGSALKTCLNAGIVPDFLVQIECYLSAYKQIEGIDLSNINMIILPTTFIDIHKLNSRNTFYYYPSNDNTSNWLASLWGIDNSLHKNKGTVSLSALLCSKHLGFKNVILIGQDLAYTDGKCYAKGSVYEDLKCTLNKDIPSDSTVTLDKPNKDVDSERLLKYINSQGKKLVPVKGQVEDIVYAPSDYALFIKYFEGVATEFAEEVRLINATEGGAFTNGFEHMSLLEALEQVASGPINVDDIVDNVGYLSNKVIAKRQEHIKNFLSDFLKLCEMMHQETRQVYEETKHLNKPEFIRYNNIDYCQCDIIHYYKPLKEAYFKIVKISEKNHLILNLLYVHRKGAEDAFKAFDVNNEDMIKYLIKNLFLYIQFAHLTYNRVRVGLEEAINKIEGNKKVTV